MKTYFIHEANMQRLEKKLATIQKKCNQNQFSFTYNQVGEEFREVKNEDGTTYTAKFIEVEVEGEVKFNGWSFVAVLDHHTEGNVIRSFDDAVQVPDRYKACGPACEHCNKIRSRKDTYVVYNEGTNEFKQVGKSCLKEFTNGINAEEAAFFVSIYDELEACGGYSGSRYLSFFNMEEMLRYAFECYRVFGYEKAPDYYEYSGPVVTTRSRATDYRNVITGNTRLRYAKEQIASLEAEIEQYHINPNSEYAVSNTRDALAWIADQPDDNAYIHNLKVVCSDDYSEWKNLGIAVSLTITYMRALEKAAAYKEKEAKKAIEKQSEFVGEVGQKLSIPTNDFTLVSTFDTIYGTTFIYKFSDTENNVFIWYSSKWIDTDEIDRVTNVSGSVKEHKAYNGVNQTILTRCKLTISPEPEEDADEAQGTFNLDEVMTVFNN